MSRALQKRLEKVERLMPPPAPRGKWHRLIGDSKAELATKRAALIASPEWQEGDNLIAIRFVDPAETRGAAGQLVHQYAAAQGDRAAA